MLELFVNHFVPGAEQRDEDGATAVEYGLMVALIAATILAAVTLLGQNLSAMYDLIANTV